MASCVVVSVLDADVVVTFCVVEFEREPLWAVTGCVVVSDCLWTGSVVAVVVWGNVTAAEVSFGVTLAVEGVIAVSSPENWRKDTFKHTHSPLK